MEYKRKHKILAIELVDINPDEKLVKDFNDYIKTFNTEDETFEIGTNDKSVYYNHNFVNSFGEDDSSSGAVFGGGYYVLFDESLDSPLNIVRKEYFEKHYTKL